MDQDNKFSSFFFNYQDLDWIKLQQKDSENMLVVLPTNVLTVEQVDNYPFF